MKMSRSLTSLAVIVCVTATAAEARGEAPAAAVAQEQRRQVAEAERLHRVGRRACAIRRVGRDSARAAGGAGAGGGADHPDDGAGVPPMVVLDRARRRYGRRGDRRRAGRVALAATRLPRPPSTRVLGGTM